jgi:hypothetical protein
MIRLNNLVVYQNKRFRDYFGIGPDLGVESSALVGDALAAQNEAFVLAAPGLPLTGPVTLGFWAYVGPTFAAGSSASAIADDGTKRVSLALDAPGTGIDFTLTAIGAATSVSLPSFSTGWHHIAMTRSAVNLVTYYHNGVAVGSATIAPVNSTAPVVDFQMNTDIGCQLMIAAYEATAPELLYVINGGLGRDVSTWEAP